MPQAQTGTEPDALTDHRCQDTLGRQYRQEVPGGPDEQREFGALRLGGDGVAGDRGGEAALRAQRKPVRIDHRACLAEPGLELFQLDLRCLGGDQAQHHDLASNLMAAPQPGSVPDRDRA